MGTLTDQPDWNGSCAADSPPKHVQRMADPLLGFQNDICINSLSGVLGDNSLPVSSVHEEA